MNNLKVLIVGDVQIHGIPGSDRYRITDRTLDWIIDVIIREKPDMFVHMGDLGEDNGSVSFYALQLMTSFISRVSKYMNTRPCYWLVGNHDYADQDGSVNLMTSLEPMIPDNSTVIWPSYSVDLFQFISYLRDNGKFLEHLTRDPRRILFTHHPIQGSVIGHGYFDKGGVPADVLPRYTIVGHYHKPRLVNENDRLICYTGSPICFDWRDDIGDTPSEWQERCIWLMDLDLEYYTPKLQRFVNPHTEYYVTIRCGSLDEFDRKLKDIVIPRDRLRFRVFCSSDLNASIISRLSKALYYRIFSIDQRDDKMSSERVGISTDMHPTAAVDTYASRAKVPATLDRDVLAKEGRRLVGGSE